MIKRWVFNGCKDSLFILFVQEKTKLLALAMANTAAKLEFCGLFRKDCIF